MFLDQPPALDPLPAPPASEERTAPAQRSTSVVTGISRHLTLETPRTMEAMVVRYYFMLTAVVGQVPVTAEATSDGLQSFCEWKMRVFLQKDFCFASVTGMTGCTPTMILDLPQMSEGTAPEGLPIVADTPACTIVHPAVVAAEERLAQNARQQAQQVADDDYNDNVRPMLEKSGVRIRVAR